MPLVCPQCKQLFEQNGICPLCNVVLLYHAQNLQSEAAPASIQDESSEWQQTPWGKILIGLILAQGLNFGLQQLVTAGLLASSDGSTDVWGTLWGIVLHHAVLAVSLLIGGALSGAGQSRGMVYGALVGLTSGIISLCFRDYSLAEFASVVVYVEPVIHLATGAIGGAIGMLIWRPIPKLPELEGTTPSPVAVSSFAFSLGNAFAGPIHPGRVCAGAFVIVMGVVWSKAILDFVLRASNGTLTISSHLQAELVSMEISALVALLGAAVAGSTTRNGLKQGLCVGLGASAVVLGIQISNPNFTLEAAVFTLSGIIIVALVGGWFGCQLFPPIDSSKRRKRLSYYS